MRQKNFNDLTCGEGSDNDLDDKELDDDFGNPLHPTGCFGWANLNSFVSEVWEGFLSTASSFSVSKFNPMFSLLAEKGSSPLFTWWNKLFGVRISKT